MNTIWNVTLTICSLSAGITDWVTFYSATHEFVQNWQTLEGKFFLLFADKAVQTRIQDHELIGGYHVIAVGGKSAENSEQFQACIKTQVLS